MSGLGNRYSQHSFAQVPSVQMARSSFDRSFTVKDTMSENYLTPMFIDEVLPGDTIDLTLNAFCRLATQQFPVMDNAYINFEFFFVPNRLVWDNWEKFNGAQDNPGDTTDYQVPYISMDMATHGVGSIYDKFGLPVGSATGDPIEINALPFRAYYLIWNTWYRDQNLQDSLVVATDDGPDLQSDYTLQMRNKKHDYFSSCLPWPQKGTAVDLPLGTTAPVVTDDTVPNFTGLGMTNSALYVFNTESILHTSHAATSSGNLKFGNNTGLQADLSGATAATINQLREAFQVQSILELDARGGTRYTEILLNHFGVVSPDFRLQRPEFLGGGEIKINNHVVPQTSQTSGSNYQGKLASFATASTQGQNIGFTKSFVEHGYVIGLASARCDVTYQQGVNKLWTRQTRFDFFWPKLQEIGEQAVLAKEICVPGLTTAQREQVFGYQERYAEYRYRPSEIHGTFRSDYSSSLDFMHYGQEINPADTAQWSLEGIVYNAFPLQRTLAAADTYPIWCDYFFTYRHARPMMTYSVPATLGRF